MNVSRGKLEVHAGTLHSVEVGMTQIWGTCWCLTVSRGRIEVPVGTLMHIRS